MWNTLRNLLLILIFSLPSLSRADSGPIPAEKAFSLKAYLTQDKQLLMVWDIAPGYYLYRNKLHFNFAPASEIKGGKIDLPTPQVIKDKDQEIFLVYMHKLKISIPLNPPITGTLDLNILYQGCSADGFCYAPLKKRLVVDFSALTGPLHATKALPFTTLSPPETDFTVKILNDNKMILMILSFLGLGILLSFTPCVLPMIPILSGIIAGHHRQRLTLRKSFLLSLSYVIGMALTYTVLGMIVALLGSRVQIFMQNPWVISLFSAFFVMLALSLFGFYKFQFPPSWQKHLIKWDRHFKGGTYPSVFFMGCFSSLIVSPCVSAPLIGVLTYIAQTGNVVLGGLALFSLGLGMGIPLLLIGTSAGKLLPKSGIWMESIQKIFGIIMLGVAVWLLSRILPETITILLSSALFILSAILLGAFKTAKKKWFLFLKVLAIIFLIYGVMLAFSLINGNREVFRPWIMFSKNTTDGKSAFTTITYFKQLTFILKKARAEHKPVLLDFYADWCTSCQLLDKKVFSNNQVQSATKNLKMLRVDITKNNADDHALLDFYKVIAPPTILFFDAQGNELSSMRLVGEFTTEQLLDHLRKMHFIE